MADISSKREQAATATTTSLSTISIDSQSFVNLGQLIGSRGHDLGDSTMATSGGASTENLGASASFLSGGGSDSDPDGLKDFAQIFHPVPSTVSAAASWVSNELCHGEGAGGGCEDDDDNDSVLPALPRSPSPALSVGSDRLRRPFTGKQGTADWIADDAESVHSDDDRAEAEQGVEDAGEQHPCPAVPEAMPGGAMGCGESTVSVPSLRESWLHIPMDNISERDPPCTSCDNSGGMIAAGLQEHAHQQDAAGMTRQKGGAATAEDGSTPDGCVARDDCGCCFACGLNRAIAVARPQFQRLSELAKRPIWEIGAEACLKAQDVCARGHAAMTQAVESVPQAPGEVCHDVVDVRGWSLYIFLLLVHC